jgi:hypothetical protein
MKRQISKSKTKTPRTRGKTNRLKAKHAAKQRRRQIHIKA